jgi:hypothetical protein
MNRFKYGSGKTSFFTILTPVNSTSIVAKLHYENFVNVGYKDYTKLWVSCDRGPEICEGCILSTTNIENGTHINFLVNKIRNELGYLWLVELERCDT